MAAQFISRAMAYAPSPPHRASRVRSHTPPRAHTHTHNPPPSATLCTTKDPASSSLTTSRHAPRLSLSASTLCVRVSLTLPPRRPCFCVAAERLPSPICGKAAAWPPFLVLPPRALMLSAPLALSRVAPQRWCAVVLSRSQPAALLLAADHRLDPSPFPHPAACANHP